MINPVFGCYSEVNSNWFILYYGLDDQLATNLFVYIQQWMFPKGFVIEQILDEFHLPSIARIVLSSQPFINFRVDVHYLSEEFLFDLRQ
jgi:hypothetical protein